MNRFFVKPACCVRGRISLLGDKSIAHRAIILSAIASGKTKIDNFPANQDCLFTAKAFEKLGVNITYNFSKHNSEAGNIVVAGAGLRGLTNPKGAVFTGDSGTTLRVILGILAGQLFTVKLSAGKFLSKRPMRRVIVPLRMMGARINSKVNSDKTIGISLNKYTNALKMQKEKLEEYPPITIRGGNLKAITYKLPVASAQVKSAVLLAGLYAKGTTRVIEKIKTRDHTERMLKLFKADIKIVNNTVSLSAGRQLISPGRIYVPGDISSASFFMVLAAIIPNSHILLRKVNLNPTRLGIITVLKRMGADIKVAVCHSLSASSEPVGDIKIKNSQLTGTIIGKKEIPFLIDELPVLMVAACFAMGRTIFEGVTELRVKETDRIKSMSENLKRMGADISVVNVNEGKNENIVIQAAGRLNGAKVKSFSDHRTAMSMIVAGLCSKGVTEIDDIDCINKSFPNFIKLLNRVVKLNL